MLIWGEENLSFVGFTKVVYLPSITKKYNMIFTKYLKTYICLVEARSFYLFGISTVCALAAMAARRAYL